MTTNNSGLIGRIALALGGEGRVQVVESFDDFECWTGGRLDRAACNFTSIDHTDGVVDEIECEPARWLTFNGSQETRYDAARRLVRVVGGTYLILHHKNGGDFDHTPWERSVVATSLVNEAELMKELGLTEEDLLAAEQREEECLAAEAAKAKAEAARNRCFAEAARKTLRDGGLSDQTISRLFKEAGPSAALHGALWALEAITTPVGDGEYHQVKWGSPHYDLVLLLIAGALSKAPGGWERTMAAFGAAGFPGLSGRAGFQARMLRAAQTTLLSKEVMGGGGDYYSAMASAYDVL